MDLLVCGHCHHEFPIDAFTQFLEHKMLHMGNKENYLPAAAAALAKAAAAASAASSGAVAAAAAAAAAASGEEKEAEDSKEQVQENGDLEDKLILTQKPSICPKAKKVLKEAETNTAVSGEFFFYSSVRSYRTYDF